MKKIITVFVAAVLLALCAFSFTVSGAEAPFKIEISGSTSVAAGSAATFTITVKDINIKSSVDGFDDGLGALSMALKFDTDFFDASTASVTCPTVENWVIDTNNSGKADGKIVIIAIGDVVQGTVPTVKENGVLTFKVSLKVKDTAAEGSGKELYIDASDVDTYACDGATMDVLDFECGSFDVSLTKKLAKPEEVEISSDLKATWKAVENADSYEIQIYKDGEKLGKALSATSTTYDISTLIQNNLGGAYTFTVCAKSSGGLHEDSDTVTSATFNYVGKLSKPSIELTTDKVAGTVGYKITDTNPEDTVGAYIIKIYDKDGKPVGEDITTTKLEGTIKDLTFGAKYDVTVIASSASLANTETGNLSSDESDKVSVTPDGIVGISVTKKPTLSYTEGETIDLSKMEITVDFAVAEDVNVTRKNFSKYGITVSPKHATDVILSLNGKKVTVTCGDLTASEEMILEVKSAQCTHPNTTSEHEDGNCGKDGYDRLICTVCGETVEDNVIPATGEHEFSEWSWLSAPTVNVDGVRERTCSVCGEVEHDQVTYAEYLAMTSDSTTAPPDTTPGVSDSGDETKPPVTTGKRKSNALGGVADLGKIFLFALIGVLLVVVVFIVGAVYMESRRNRRRRSNSRTNQARSNARSSGRSSNNGNNNKR